MFKPIGRIFLLGLAFAGPGHVSAEDHRSATIEEVKWEAGDALLVAKGKAPRRTGVTIRDGGTLATIKETVSNREGKWRIRLTLEKPPCSIQAVSDGQVVTQRVENADRYCHSSTGGGGDSGSGGTGTGTTPSGDYVSLAINDLGMHCADLDYQIFSILPPYNVMHGQVIRKGAEPEIMDSSQVDLYYRATANPADTIPPGTITTTSTNVGGRFKSNFWTPGADGRKSYTPLYPPGVLDMFALPGDTGLPAPDVERLYLGDGQLAAHQQRMPGPDNSSQAFLGYVKDFPFFTGLPFGYTAGELNRFTAEGIPILPLADPDAAGEQIEAPYPLMQVTAVRKGADPGDAANHLASVRTVLPVASEADCQLCHADQDVCDQSQLTAGLACNGQAASFAQTPFEVVTGQDIVDQAVPGSTLSQAVQNAAKINILRLHDAKHDTHLDEQRNIVCAGCHYSPALDLAQLGPNDDNGKEQTRHISMSRAMHGFHGEFSELFPDMPAPGQRSPAQVEDVLAQTCYACHPGKRTQCLRGAMTQSGIVCQDCHGNMKQVGNDFSAALPNNTPDSGANWVNNLDWTRRIPWASEPGCQSCHTGDALDNLAGAPDVIPSNDGIRLLQAYRTGDVKAGPIKAVNRRFAETRDTAGNDHLYRLSKGHGGVMCEGCHGSTHAIWPNPWEAANDNLTARDLQGHSGTITECSTCHAGADLGLTLDGPHGMHPVASSRWNKDHEDMAKRNRDQCRSCHGRNGEGTVLSRTAATREWTCDSEKGTLCNREGQRVTVARGTRVGCSQCHSNKINGD